METPAPSAVTPSLENDPLLGNSLTALLEGAAFGSTEPATGEPIWTPSAPEDLATLLPGYEIESLIGRGGMGAVYKARQVRLNRTVAIKLLPAELAVDAEFVQRFEREAQTLAGLSHPGIVGIFDSGQTEAGHLYFVMEHVDGTNLQQTIQEAGLSAAQALDITIQVCEALRSAHEQGVIHRDIKPANVLLTRAGKAKLADFGLARPLVGSLAEGTLTSPTRVIGSPHYMAPEQWQGKSDCRTDIYALGVTLYEMLTRTRPALNYEPPSTKAEVDERLDDVVDRALRQQPEQRYQAVTEMQQDVDRIRTTPKLHRRVVRGRQPATPARRRAFDVLMWSLALLLIGALAYGVVAVMQSKPVLTQLAPTPAAGGMRIDEAQAAIASLMALLEKERAEYRDALAVINLHTQFKKTPVTQGTSAYYKCLAASKVIQNINATAPVRTEQIAKIKEAAGTLGDQPLKDKIAEVEAALHSLKAQLEQNTALPAGSIPASAEL